jgi:hypothetical protein
MDRQLGKKGHFLLWSGNLFEPVLASSLLGPKPPEKDLINDTGKIGRKSRRVAWANFILVMLRGRPYIKKL